MDARGVKSDSSSTQNHEGPGGQATQEFVALRASLQASAVPRLETTPQSCWISGIRCSSMPSTFTGCVLRASATACSSANWLSA